MYKKTMLQMITSSKTLTLWFAISTLLHLPLLFKSACSQPFIGVNYGELADNLPPPETTAKLLQSTTITNLRLYGVNPSMITALAGTGISLTIGTSNADIPSLAADPSAAAAWVASNVLPFHPASKISTISVGNEIFLSDDPTLTSNLLPAMSNLHAAVADPQIKISTVHPMSVFENSSPPSATVISPAVVDALTPILSFLQQTGSPFMINPYPFFAYQSDPRPETLDFCLFRPNPGRPDSGSGKVYTNMFDAQVDAVRSALRKVGFGDVEVVVAETGWAYRGDDEEKGASLENAKAYNGNLVAHLRSLAGTPLVPGKAVETYLFALYDEDLKPGPGSERAFGIYRPDQTMIYDVGLAKSDATTAQTQTTPTPAPVAQPPPEPSISSTPPPQPQTSVDPPPMPSVPETSGAAPKPSGRWCVPKASGVTSEQLQENIDYVCGQAGVDCNAIQPGGKCYEPNTVASHAAYAMNLLYQSSEKSPGSCDFTQTATTTDIDPSYDTCAYPGT